jgi:hypothetical protein
MPPQIPRAKPVARPFRTWPSIDCGARALIALSVLSLGACKSEGEGEPAAASSVNVVVSPAKAAPTSEVKQEPVRVHLDGSTEALAVSVVSKGPRIYSKQLRTWVYEKPADTSKRLGYLRAGASSPTADKPVGTSGCKGGWYPVEPRGFVCLDKSATLDPKDPIVKALETYHARFEAKLPYMYGTVRKPGPVYQRLPKPEELLDHERGYEKRMNTWFEAGGEIGASYAQTVWTWGAPPPDPKTAFLEKLTQGVPDVLSSGNLVPNLSGTPRSDSAVLENMRTKVGYSFVDTFFYEGRRYGLTPELEVVPTDRLRPIQGSDFHGVEVGKDVEFPFAFVRHEGAKFVGANGKVSEEAPYRAVVKLTGKQRFFGGVLHFETEDGQYLSDRHASRLDLAKKMPAWAQKGEKWIDVNITKQTLVLYEGTKAVFATLISSGEAGLASSEGTTATRRGIFRIHTKHVTATMASDETGEEFELRDVPYVQYFEDGYALHGAYWHDRFGTPKSHGCINLAPEDARRVFSWTEPQVPTGWYGALLPLEGTVMFVHQ